MLFAREFVTGGAWKWVSLAGSGSLASIGVTACVLSFSLLHGHVGGGGGGGLWWVNRYVYAATVVSAVSVAAGYGNIDKSMAVGLGVYTIGRFGVAFFWVFKCAQDAREMGKEEVTRSVWAAAGGSVLFFVSIIFNFLPLGWVMVPAVIWAVKEKDGEGLMRAEKDVVGGGRA